MNPLTLLVFPFLLALDNRDSMAVAATTSGRFHGIPALLADFTNLPIVAIVAVGGSLMLTAVIIVCGLRFAQRREELWHETARLALEKGQPLPPLPEKADPQKPDEDNDFRTGLILVATGAGLYLFMGTFLSFLRYVGAIPGLIGVALLVYATLKAAFFRKPKLPADRSPLL